MNAAILTCDLLSQHIPFKSEWNHLADLTFADPDFGRLSKIDLLLAVEVFSEVVRHHWRYSTPGSLSAFETDFGWVLAGTTNTHVSHLSLLTHQTTEDTCDGLLLKFWEIEEQPTEHSCLSPEECSVVQNFLDCHSREKDGRFIVRNLRQSHLGNLARKQ